MIYQFDTGLAREYSVEEAVFVHNIHFWVMTNAANRSKIHFHEGCYWTFQTLSGLVEIFDFIWSDRQISRIVDKCRKSGLIKTGNFNKDRRDRTLWYTTTEVVNCIYRNRQMATPNSVNDDTEIGKCIKGTDNNPDNNPDIGRVFQDYAGDDTELAEELSGFVAMRKARRKKPTDRACEILVKKLDELSGGDRDLKIRIIRESIEHSWDSFYPPKDAPGKGRGEPTGEGYNLL